LVARERANGNTRQIRPAGQLHGGGALLSRGFVEEANPLFAIKHFENTSFARTA